MSLEISKARARIPPSTLCARRQKINAFSWEIEPLCPAWFCLLAAVHLCYLINFSLSLYFNTFENTAFKHDSILPQIDIVLTLRMLHLTIPKRSN
jgi:hypothetical protein